MSSINIELEKCGGVAAEMFGSIENEYMKIRLM